MTTTATLSGRRILLGVTGGIAAYKAAYLARELVKAGAEVQVVMTEQAQQFVGSMTFAALTNRPVRTTLNDEQAELAMGHIELARWADTLLIAPATANTIGKIAQGFADNLLTTVVLASKAPLVIAPAMNQQMWAAEATQANLQTLRERGVQFIGPDSGDQACGDVGAGRMSEPDDILQYLIATGIPGEADLSASISGNTGNIGNTGKPLRVLLTAGPTREAIDPVRYLSNNSSGNMGYAIAEAFVAIGAAVTLVSGPTCLATPAGVSRVDVSSAREMLEAVDERAGKQDIFISVAAVSDYRPAVIAGEKIKKTDAGNDELTLSLVKNPDILQTIAGRADHRPFCVGFAAETQSVVAYAKEKLARKNLDMICANHVGGSVSGFGDQPNALTVITADSEQSLPMSSKKELATALVPLIIQHYEQRES